MCSLACTYEAIFKKQNNTLEANTRPYYKKFLFYFLFQFIKIICSFIENYIYRVLFGRIFFYHS